MISSFQFLTSSNSIQINWERWSNIITNVSVITAIIKYIFRGWGKFGWNGLPKDIYTWIEKIYHHVFFNCEYMQIEIKYLRRILCKLRIIRNFHEMMTIPTKIKILTNFTNYNIDYWDNLSLSCKGGQYASVYLKWILGIHIII